MFVKVLNMDRKEVISYVDTVSTVIVAVTLFFLPVIFLTTATDAFIVPKQLLITVSALILLVLWGIKSLYGQKIIATATPMNLPIAIFGLVVVVSAVLSANRYDSLMQAVPVAAAVILSFLIFNIVKTRSVFNVVLSAYVLGAAASALITVLYYFKLYFIPIAVIQSQFFNTTGSAVQQIIYLVPLLIFVLIYLGNKLNFPKMRPSTTLSNDYGFYIQSISAGSIVAGLAVIAYQIIFLPNKPILLPYVYGFQTAFASISQDASRFIAGLLFGSGFGTFLIDFTRYKLPSFNLEQNIWNLTFSFSSSFFLELIATTGILGALAFLGIVVSFVRTRAPRSPLFAALFIAFILAFILPFSFIAVASLFILIGLYLAHLNVEGDKRVYDVTLSLVTAKSGIPTFEAVPEGERQPARSALLPGIILLIILGVVSFVGFYTFKFASSDMDFARSLVAAQSNNGQRTYELQARAINNFPYRSDYQRIFSQVNLALANSLATSVPAGTQPSADVQQNILALLQQSINSGRNAVTLSPRTSLAWQNLGVVYRSLIGVGQNADQFAISSMNQAIALDPYNPNLYILLGGVYYQLQQWDQAANQFNVAISLKRDFSNAYYNLGHAYESKGDLQNALTAYQAVRQLSVDNKDNLARIDAEIKALQDKIGAAPRATDGLAPQTEQTPLSLPESETNLPEQKPPVKISPPPSASESAR